MLFRKCRCLVFRSFLDDDFFYEGIPLSSGQPVVVADGRVCSCIKKKSCQVPVVLVSYVDKSSESVIILRIDISPSIEQNPCSIHVFNVKSLHQRSNLRQVPFIRVCIDIKESLQKRDILVDDNKMNRLQSSLRPCFEPKGCYGDSA